MNKKTEKFLVKDFVEGYKKITGPQQKEAYLNKKLNITPYVGYIVKELQAKNIVKESSLDDKGNVSINSSKRYILYIYSLIKLYTNLDMEPADIINDYDLLESAGLLDEILKRIPEKEKGAFDVMVKMQYDDFMTNYYSIHGYLDNKLQTLYPHIGNAVTRLLDSSSEFLENLDMNKIEKLLKKLQK